MCSIVLISYLKSKVCVVTQTNSEKTSWTTDELISFAKNCWKNGEIQKIEALCNNLLSQANGQESEIFWVVGLIGYEIQQPEIAIKYLSDSINIVASAEKYFVLATAYSNLKNDFKQVFSCLQKAIEFQPSAEEHEKIFASLLNCREHVADFLAWRNLGLYYLKQDSCYKSFYCFRKALDIQPDSTEIYAFLVKSAKGNNKFYEYFSKYTGDKEDDPYIIKLYFTALLGSSRHPAVDYHPQEQLWSELGEIYLYIHRYDLAFYFLRKASLLEPRSDIIFSLLLVCGEQLNDFSKWKELGIFYSKVPPYSYALICLRKALNIQYSTEIQNLLLNLSKGRDCVAGGTFIDIHDNSPKLSILMLAYNLEKFIAQAVESVLQQQIDFSSEFHIIENCSTDGTREILQRYAKLYPDKIKLILHERNMGSKYSALEGLRLSTGKYLSCLDGDDYWISPTKLQKQIDFLDRHPDFMMCAHNTMMIYENGSHPSESMIKQAIKSEHTILDFVSGASYFHISSLVFRNLFYSDLPDCMSDDYVGDYFMNIFYAQYGNVKYFDEVMSAYRIHDKGMWSNFNQLEKEIKNLDGLVIYNRLLNYKYNSFFTRLIWHGCWNILRQCGQENPNIVKKYTALAHSLEFKHYNLDISERERNKRIYDSFPAGTWFSPIKYHSQ